MPCPPQPSQQWYCRHLSPSRVNPWYRRWEISGRCDSKDSDRSTCDDSTISQVPSSSKWWIHKWGWFSLVCADNAATSIGAWQWLGGSDLTENGIHWESSKKKINHSFVYAFMKMTVPASLGQKWDLDLWHFEVKFASKQYLARVCTLDDIRGKYCRTNFFPVWTRYFRFYLDVASVI